MNCARNYENVLNFVKVMPKILLVPFFPNTVYVVHQTHRTTPLLPPVERFAQRGRPLTPVAILAVTVTQQLRSDVERGWLENSTSLSKSHPERINLWNVHEGMERVSASQKLSRDP